VSGAVRRAPKSSPHLEWIEACKGGPLPGSNFDYAGALTETVLLGTIAMRHKGKKLEWNSKALKITNDPAANGDVNKVYRQF
jgi:hypothetical protein